MSLYQDPPMWVVVRTVEEDGINYAAVPTFIFYSNVLFIFILLLLYYFF